MNAIWKDKLIIVPWILVVAAVVLSTSIAAVKFAGDDSQFVINYSYDLKPVLGDIGSLNSAFGILAVLLVINLALTFYMYSHKKFFGYVISICSLAISLIFFITIFTLISIN